MQLDIPSDVIDIMRVAPEYAEYVEFDISIGVNDKGQLVVRDMLGVWANDKYGEDFLPDQAWAILRKWWANEQEGLAAKEEKAKIQKQIEALQAELEGLENTAKKRKWFW
jgi:hypothetical protein